MSLNWNAVKARLLRRKIVDVELPEFVPNTLRGPGAHYSDGLTESERHADAQADSHRRAELTRAGVTDLATDRHIVRSHYRSFFGQP